MKMIKRPNRLIWALGKVLLKKFAKRINLKVNDNVTGVIKPPFIVLANHSSVQDYKIDSFVLQKFRPNHVGAYNQFIRKSFIMRELGAVPKRQFVADISLIHQIKHVMKNDGVFVIYPEGGISVDGTNRAIDPSIAKLIRLIGVPVVALNIKGSYLSKPRWNETQQKTDQVQADLNVLFSIDQIKQMSVENIHLGVVKALSHNVWEWQKKSKVRILSTNFLKGAECLIYKCPNCFSEFSMSTTDNTIKCDKCEKSWNIEQTGEFNSTSFFKFSDISKWVGWQRQEIKKEIDSGKFELVTNVNLLQLKNFSGYKNFGNGALRQTVNGITYVGMHNNEKVELNFPTLSTRSCSLSRNNIELSVSDNSYKFVMTDKNLSSKIYLALSESHNLIKKI